MSRNGSIFSLAGLAALLATALALAGCGGGSNNSSGSTTPPTTSSGKRATLGVANSNLGTILVDSQGRTLYLFGKDSGSKSSCTGACATNWPPLKSGKPTEGSGAKASLVATSTRPDGSAQVTYNGHPLYMFQGDKNPGDTNGEGLDAFGGRWYALSPTGNQITAPPANGGGGGGFGY